MKQAPTPPHPRTDEPDSPFRCRWRTFATPTKRAVALHAASTTIIVTQPGTSLATTIARFACNITTAGPASCNICRGLPPPAFPHPCISTRPSPSHKFATMPPPICYAIPTNTNTTLTFFHLQGPLPAPKRHHKAATHPFSEDDNATTTHGPSDKTPTAKPHLRLLSPATVALPHHGRLTPMRVAYTQGPTRAGSLHLAPHIHTTMHRAPHMPATMHRATSPWLIGWCAHPGARPASRTSPTPSHVVAGCCGSPQRAPQPPCHLAHQPPEHPPRMQRRRHSHNVGTAPCCCCPPPPRTTPSYAPAVVAERPGIKYLDLRERPPFELCAWTGQLRLRNRIRNRRRGHARRAPHFAGHNEIRGPSARPS